MKKVTEYEILRKAQQLAQHLSELCIGFARDDQAGLAGQITAISSSMPNRLIQASSDTTPGYLNSIRQVSKDNEALIRYLLIARDKGYLSFSQWQRWSDELDLFAAMLTVMVKSITYQPQPLSLTFSYDFNLQ